MTDYYGPSEDGEPGRIRAYANYDKTAFDETSPPPSIREGHFGILIDQGAGTVPYQGITPISGGTLTESAQTYFAQSEQLPTRFALRFGKSTLPGQAESWRAGGIMLQHMPKASPAVSGEGGSGEDGLLAADDLMDADSGENWNRVNILLDTVEEIELIGPSIAPTDLLFRLFHEEAPRVFDAQAVRFGCTCSAERVVGSLSGYPKSEIAEMVTDEGVVTADCQFCGKHYRFDPAELGSSGDHD